MLLLLASAIVSGGGTAPGDPPRESPGAERSVGRMITDASASFLDVPDDIYSPPYDFEVASTPPVVDFGKVDLSGLGEGDPFGSWGEVTRGPGGAFHFNVGNHKGFDGGSAWLIRYDPTTRRHEIVLDSQRTCGWSRTDFGDGKIHGIPTVSPGGDVWQLTFFGPYPRKSDWGTRYLGSWLIHLNLNEGRAECLGRPVGDESWPIHTWDVERGRLYAVGE